MFKKGIKEGYGEYYYQNGDYYKGEFRDDKKNGPGEYFFNLEKATYVGNFERNYQSGKGQFKYGNGDKYEGMFKKGLKEGQGKFVWKNG